MKLRASCRLVSTLTLVAVLVTACGGEGWKSASTLEETPAESVQKNERLVAKLPNDVGRNGTLKIATDASNPPMEFLQEDGQTLAGFEIDVGNAIGDILGLKVEWTNLASSGIPLGLASSRFDLALTSAQDLPERQEVMSFVDYLLVGSNLLVPAGNPEEIADFKNLCGKTLGVQAGTAQLIGAEQRQTECPTDKQIDIRTFPNNNAAALALRSERVDAIFNQEYVNSYLLKQNEGHYELVDKIYDETPIGVCLQKGNPLIYAVEGAMKELVKTGAYEQIVKKWNLESNVADEVTINGAK